MDDMTHVQPEPELQPGFVRVRTQEGLIRSVPGVMYQKQAKNMKWTLVETEPIQVAKPTPTQEIMDVIESQKAKMEAPVVETIEADNTDELKAEIEKLKAELAKKECKPECKTVEVTATASDLLKKDEPVKETPKPAAKKAPVKRRTTRKKTTK